jgi:arylsulfatase A-like enzyme
MLDELGKRGLLENTLVIVTSDHGMPFPRAKGQVYPASNQVPLAVRWPKGVREEGRVVDEFVDFTDVAPTLLDFAGVDWAGAGLAPAAGRSWREIFWNYSGTARTGPPRDHVLVGKERHDVGRPGDVGYPVRGVVKDGFLYLQNFEPSRWPACNPETGYLNCDASPTKTLILEARRRNPGDPFWALCFGKHPAEELYDLTRDPDCVHNVAADPKHQERRARMQREMTEELKSQGDPRMFGKGDVFDRYPISTEEIRNFYERHRRGEKVKAGWADENDFEKAPLE